MNLLWQPGGRGGAATSEASQGISASTLQRMGRWSSSAGGSYIRPDLDTMLSNRSCRFSSRHCDPPPPQAPPIGVAATILQHHHQCLDSMGGFCMRRYQHLYPWFILLQDGLCPFYTFTIGC
ncbi:hypothetical protein EYF80_003679 [Liparis tanakae]|uniref:Uncharacterized protein n=1 Tax=Liparis tanakae TaxID=230148 RepID=A0A4Z2JA30_9TELE|nr:hypothetical protein EYF80_003679 [Liparis tanakae]